MGRKNGDEGEEKGKWKKEVRWREEKGREEKRWEGNWEDLPPSNNYGYGLGYSYKTKTWATSTLSSNLTSY